MSELSEFGLLKMVLCANSAAQLQIVKEQRQ